MLTVKSLRKSFLMDPRVTLQLEKITALLRSLLVVYMLKRIFVFLTTFKESSKDIDENVTRIYRFSILTL